MNIEEVPSKGGKQDPNEGFVSLLPPKTRAIVDRILNMGVGGIGTEVEGDDEDEGGKDGKKSGSERETKDYNAMDFTMMGWCD